MVAFGDERASSLPAPPGTAHPPILLSDEERETLARWARRPTSSQALALRCRIVLAGAQGRSNVEAARQLGVHEKTVGKWRTRFLQRRLDGLSDEPRPGVPRSITDAQVEQVITTTLEQTRPLPPTGRPDRWPGPPA
jgi:DNA-binding CsgD family transcriptional regulator